MHFKIALKVKKREAAQWRERAGAGKLPDKATSSSLMASKRRWFKSRLRLDVAAVKPLIASKPSNGRRVDIPCQACIYFQLPYSHQP